MYTFKHLTFSPFSVLLSVLFLTGGCLLFNGLKVTCFYTGYFKQRGSWEKEGWLSEFKWA